jgi:hypothetical protein
LRKKLLETALPFYQKLAEQAPGDPEREAARGRAFGRLGDTYITGPEAVTAQDRLVVSEAVEEAKHRNPRTAEAVFDFVGDAVLLRCVKVHFRVQK